MRRIGALCMLAALAALHAPAILAAVQAAPSGDHHHPGCPWEAREEPCPHQTDPPGRSAAAWAPCPPIDALVPLAVGPDVGPRAEGIPREAGRRPARPIVTRISAVDSTFSPRPDPRPPRGAILAR